MKLYYAPGACSMTPHIVLNELGLDYEAVKVDLKTKTTPDGDSFGKINGKGYVPVLELDDGKRLTEVAAIVQYLADQKPGAGLAPAAGSFEHYQLLEWLTFISSEIHKGMGMLFNPAASGDWRQSSIDRLTNRLDWLSKQLNGKSYLLGQQFTIADAYLFNILSWSRHVKFDLGPWPNLVEYMNRVQARPAVVETLKSEGLLR